MQTQLRIGIGKNSDFIKENLNKELIRMKNWGSAAKVVFGREFFAKKCGKMSFQTYSSRYDFFCKIAKCTTLYVD